MCLKYSLFISSNSPSFDLELDFKAKDKSYGLAASLINVSLFAALFLVEYLKVIDV